MLKTPMHNRFAEGFLESHSWGWRLDALSTRITPTPFLDLEIEEFHRRARIARDAAIAAALVRAWQELRAIVRAVNPVTPLLGWYRGWRARQRAADELFALDDRTLAELGLRRGDIPFVVAGAVPSRDDARDSGHPRAANDRIANDNDDSQHAA